MKASQVIIKLQEAIARVGDREVVAHCLNGDDDNNQWMPVKSIGTDCAESMPTGEIEIWLK